jgi:hypothetical protein
MRVAERTTERLVLTGSSPLFRPFLIGGLGLAALGLGAVLGALSSGLSLSGPLPGDRSTTPIGGLAAFLVPFGGFLVLALRLGAIPSRQEVVVDRVNGRLTRCSRSLRGLSQEMYDFPQIRAVTVERTALDGDFVCTAMAQLGSGKSVALSRPTDRETAEEVAQLVRSYLTPA